MAKKKVAKEATAKRREQTEKLLKKKKAQLAKYIADQKKKAKKPTKKKASKKVAKKKRNAMPKLLPIFIVGSFVYLPPFEDNPGVYGQIQHVENGMYTVKLNEKYRDDPHDDLLREVSADQMKYCLHEKAIVLKQSHGTLFTYQCPDCERTWDVDTSG
jgi:hypothetical protein